MAAPAPAMIEIDTGSLADKVQTALLQNAANFLKVKIENIDLDTELSEYGFDSIMFTEFANILNQEHKLELTPTIFFEYPTLHSFAQYLSEEHQANFADQFSAPFRAMTTVVEPAGQAEESWLKVKLRKSLPPQGDNPGLREYGDLHRKAGCSGTHCNCRHERDFPYGS